jgi:hypothetical protein
LYKAEMMLKFRSSPRLEKLLKCEELAKQIAVELFGGLL